MAHEIKFGTDGWRGVIAEDFTFDNVRRCAQGVATYFAAKCRARERGMVVGYDYRFASEHFAAAAAEVLAANDIPVWLVETGTPTPVISYAVLANRAAGAINITASHNPATDNGFKVRSEFGGAVAPEVLKEIEAAIPGVEGVKRMSLADARAAKLVRLFDPSAAYLAHLPTLIDVTPLQRAGLRVIHDPMWGVGSGWLKRILGGGTTVVSEIHSGRNPIFPDLKRPEPIPPNTEHLQREVVAQQASVGILTDGDADRVGFVAENGRFINQLEVYALLAYYLLEVRGRRGPIVKTISTTSMLNRLGEIYQVPVYETGVGFKYVAPKMIETNALIGGEESGGFAFGGHMPERDGIVAALFLLDLMVQLNKTPSQLLEHLFSLVGPHYYDRIDTPFPPEHNAEVRERIRGQKPAEIAGIKVTNINTLDGFRYEMQDGGWLLIRFSGTEPIIRVYTETTRADKVQEILQAGLALAGLSDQTRAVH